MLLPTIVFPASAPCPRAAASSGSTSRRQPRQSAASQRLANWRRPPPAACTSRAACTQAPELRARPRCRACCKRCEHHPCNSGSLRASSRRRSSAPLVAQQSQRRALAPPRHSRQAQTSRQAPACGAGGAQLRRRWPHPGSSVSLSALRFFRVPTVTANPSFQPTPCGRG
jgi:hypothetical protein